MRRLKLGTALVLSVLALVEPARPAHRVVLATDGKLPPAAEYGLLALEKALEAKGFDVERTSRIGQTEADFLVVAGTLARQGVAAKWLAALNADPPDGPEALVIRRTQIEGSPAVVLCGSDARGLMYAALDTAERIGWSEDVANPFSAVEDTREKPYIAERAVSIYTMQRAYFESRLYDENHWRRYFEMLARSRINSFVVIFGYENGGFLAPAYPYFFDVEGYSEVKLVGINAQQQQRNTEAFQRMIEIAHAHGVDFGVAIWDHIYRGGVQGGGIAGASEMAGKRVPGLVYGVTAENLAPYTKAGLRKFLNTFSEIDTLQFRMHGESGLKKEEMPIFWHEVFAMIRDLRPLIRIDIRAKELPDSIIHDGLDQGLALRVATKHWMEQMGMPFHPTHVNRRNQHDRRHGYADLLSYPQRYRVHWRLWNGGTTRLLLWADPDYVRRFAENARLYDGNSYEVNEMLATKMLGEPHERKPFELLNPKYRYYVYEFERYWHFYQVWGRVGYNPDVSPSVWRQQFQRRFGPVVGKHLMAAIHLASRVLPRIVAASYRYGRFPTTRGWAEMMRMGDLKQYAEAEGSDIQQFMNVHDQAESVLAGTDTAMRRPDETSRWFASTSREILGHAEQAERTVGRLAGNEFLSTLTDVRILGYLAQYHANRLHAGVYYNLYQQTGDLFAFDDAIVWERRAIAAWEKMVKAADDLYNRDLAFGVHHVGFPRHWEEELRKLRRGLDELVTHREEARLKSGSGAEAIAHVPVRRVEPGKAIKLRATIGWASEPQQVRVLVAEGGPEFSASPMKRVEAGLYEARVRPRTGSDRLRYVIEAVDADGSRSVLPPGGTREPFEVTISADRLPPQAWLERATKARPGRDLLVRANVSDPSGVRQVRLRYRHLTQFEDYEAVEMRLDGETGLYEASVPGKFIVPEWDLMYFLEVIDEAGNGRMYPDLEKEMPYVVVKVER